MLDLVIDLVDQKYWEDYFFDALNNAERVLTVAPGGKVDVEVVGNGLETDDQVNYYFYYLYWHAFLTN